MKTLIDIEQCTGCGNCLKFCTKNILELTDKKTLNAKGVRYVKMSHEKKCIYCGICELMCTAGAIHIEGRKENGYSLIDQKEIPPHAGCYLGTLTKVLCDIVCEMKIEDQIVIFKCKASDVNLHVETHDYMDNSYFFEGLKFKEEHPEKIVVLICSSSKIHSTETNEERFRNLKKENVTIINTMNWFESDSAITKLTKGESHIIEELAERSDASFLARGNLQTPGDVDHLKKYLKQAIQNQINGQSFSIVEFTFPCFYRLANRPQVSMDYEEIEKIRTWYTNQVRPQYQEGIFRKQV